ncbi:NmrA family transcriptional regulator [Streptomyces viridochromogenes]|uniref:NmrA family transcriptional regulator n=1 Tax=Streptomyces viridochromogenes TaxID=1938 RepID=A0A0J7ZDD6_STRVR|nr:NAD(P)H-binding protein [Streptomyces viridochromogenes]KMS73228.1 NmrA family transcriptional regulator [Streptomyces viridochromogenes]KOG17400.1 NmrA family transcriptional regulator [Streptomyces viridochromogenes]KOG18385.1 NmrA family transcriptional regulator [Streptomyces viridochromogenes]
MTDKAAETANTQRMTVVVTGASGRTGSRVAEAARGAGLTVRAASRARGFDWEDPTTWAQTLRDADAAYLMYPSDVGSPAAAEGVGALAREAVGLGVRRLVLLSARGEDQALPTEAALTSSGADWTIVRATWFSQNFSEGPLVEGMVHGELVFPAGEVKEPFVDVRDIADVVTAVLTSGDRYVGRTLELTGPRLLSWREAVAEISEAAGSTITYTPVPTRAYGQALTGFGVPAEEVELLIEVFDTLMDGRNAHVTGDVREVLGREPRDFADFAREAAAAGAWKA